MQQQSNKEIIKRFYELISNGDDKGASEYLADNLVWKEIATSRPMTLAKNEVIQGFGRMRAGFTEGKLRMTPLGFIAEGNRVAVEFESYAETKNGKVYNNKYHSVWEFEGNRAKEVRSYSDTAHAMAVIMIQPEA